MDSRCHPERKKCYANRHTESLASCYAAPFYVDAAFHTTPDTSCEYTALTLESHAREYVFGNQEPPDIRSNCCLSVTHCTKPSKNLQLRHKLQYILTVGRRCAYYEPPHTDPIAKKIAEASRRLRTVHAVDTVVWVPGHCRVPGNEAAHAAASAILINLKPPQRRSNLWAFAK